MDKQLAQVREFNAKHRQRTGGEELRLIQSVSQALDLEDASEAVIKAAKNLIHSPCVAAQRASLILEEAGEVGHALATANLVELADGLADLLYVVFGTAVAYDIPIEKIFDEVHRSNMTKNVSSEALVKGKLSKGPGYSPPDIAGILSADGLV